MNTNFTKNPIVGTPLTPSVIKQIHTAVRRYMPIAGNGIRTSVTAGGTIISAIPAPAPKNQKDKPLPFEVRYDGTLDSGAGGWKIYLPTEHLVQFDGAYLDPLNDVTPILDSNGDETGWYSFDEITLHDDHVWLVISESSGAYTASFENAEDQQAVANICIAEVSYEADTQSTPETITIKQSVVGALVFGGGLEFAPAPFDIGETKRDAQPGEEGDEDGKVVVSGIVNCKFFWDGVEKTLPDYPAPSGTATVYLNCVGTESQSASAVNGYTWTFEMSTSEVSTGGNIYRNYKLYDFNAGEVVMDWRDTFLALYSGTANRAEPDGVSIDKIPDAAPGATPDGDEGKLEIKGFKSAVSSELTLDSTAATTVEFLARNPGNPESLVFRKLKVPSPGGADTDDVSINKIPHDDSQGADNTDEGKIQIKGWDKASPGVGQLASILVGDDEQVSQYPLDRADVPIRDPNDGSLKYAGIGILPTDGQTITLENDPQAAAPNHRFALVGYSSATAGQIPVKRAGGLSWENAPSGGADISALNGVTLVTNVEWIGSPLYVIRVTKRACTVANNVLTLGNAQMTDIFTTPLSQE